MSTALQWQPAPQLREKIALLAQQRGIAPELIITEAVEHYLEAQTPDLNPATNDPLIGLFAGSPDLATYSEEILQQEIAGTSGWTWKQP